MSTRHYKVVRPVRFFLFILISIMVIVFAGYSLLSNSTEAEAASAGSYERVVVQESDTLWGLAEMYNPDSDVSYRDIVYDICDINDISSGDIHPGDVLYIPVF